MKQLILLIFTLSFWGCKSGLDNSIKQGNFDACSKYTVESLVNNFVGNPQWESFVSPDDDKYHLNLSGTCMYDGKSAKLLVQFQINEDETWFINAFELNGEPQPDEMIGSLVEAMCSDMENSGKQGVNHNEMEDAGEATEADATEAAEESDSPSEAVEESEAANE